MTVPIWAPQRWLLVFETKCDWRWRRLIPGKFKHVFAVGYVAAIETWIVYSVERDGTKVGAFRPGADFNSWLGSVIPHAGVLRIKTQHAARRMPWFSFWCVPAVKHLLGLRSGALWPDQLWRYCLANGAEIVVDADAGTGSGDRSREGGEDRR
jgi:hypothetical protein